MMKQATLFFCCMFFICSVKSQNQAPEISNLEVIVDNPNQLTINYDLADNENDDIEITFRVSDDGGETYVVNTASATGDVGFPLSSGTGKSITWDSVEEIPEDGTYKVMLVADDKFVIDIQDIVDQVDSNRLRTDLEFIEGIRHRNAGAAHLQEVKDMINDHFVSHDLETKTLSFSWNGYNAENFVGRKLGLSSETETYIIDGHFDTVIESPGADDNGSAIVGVMEALRVLAPYQFAKTIKFIGFDLEEEGLVGSLNYVNSGGIEDYETIKGVFNFEMIGYYDNSPNSQTLPNGFNILFPDAYNEVMADDFRGNFITNVGIYNHPGFSASFESAAATYVPDLRVISIDAPNGWAFTTPDLGRSDHAAFWLEAMPALMLTDGSNFRNPYYHTPNDTVGTLNFTFMSNVVKATVAAIAELAEIQHSTFQTAFIGEPTHTKDAFDCAFEVFPNPGSDYIQLDLSECSFEDFNVKIYNAGGKILYSKDQLSGLQSISTKQFTSGTYVLFIQKGEHSIQKKIVINH